VLLPPPSFYKFLEPVPDRNIRCDCIRDN